MGLGSQHSENPYEIIGPSEDVQMILKPLGIWLMEIRYSYNAKVAPHKLFADVKGNNFIMKEHQSSYLHN